MEILYSDVLEDIVKNLQIRDIMHLMINKAMRNKLIHLRMWSKFCNAKINHNLTITLLIGAIADPIVQIIAKYPIDYRNLLLSKYNHRFTEYKYDIHYVLTIVNTFSILEQLNCMFGWNTQIFTNYRLTKYRLLPYHGTLTKSNIVKLLKYSPNNNKFYFKYGRFDFSIMLVGASISRLCVILTLRESASGRLSFSHQYNSLCIDKYHKHIVHISEIMKIDGKELNNIPITLLFCFTNIGLPLYTEVRKWLIV